MKTDGAARSDADGDRQESGTSTWKASRVELAIQAALERLYARSKTRYVELLTAVMVGSILLFIVPGFTALFFR